MVTLLLTGAASACGQDPSPTPDPLKIGLLMYFTEGMSIGRSLERRKGFELAIKHINDAGGVFGQPVEFTLGDTMLDPAEAEKEARRLIEVEGVHAIVGPSTSANSLAVVRNVAGPAKTPVVSPSATSPQLTTVVDDDFFFRTALSDTAQGPVLARVTRERGFANVGVVYQDDAWGQGLAESFTAAWTGTLKSVPTQRGGATYLAELRETASEGAEALVLIVSEAEAETMIRESIENGLYDRFTFGDAIKSPELVKKIGGAHLAGMYGTGGTASMDNPSSVAWDAAYVAEYGALPGFAFVRETYDAVIAIALAAQAAGRANGTAIRDHLRAVGSAPGEVVIAGSKGRCERTRDPGQRRRRQLRWRCRHPGLG